MERAAAGDMQGVLPEGQEAHINGVVRLLPGDFALCTTTLREWPYALVPVRRLSARWYMALGGAAVPKDARCEIALPIRETDDHNVLRGVFEVEALHTDALSRTTLVLICGRDPRYGDSFAWYPTKCLCQQQQQPYAPAHSLALPVGTRVHVCRWEWEFLHRITWHTAKILEVSNGGIYTVEYTPPLRFKCEEGDDVTHYTEHGVTFTRIRC